MQDRAVFLYREEKLWKQRLGATDASHPYVVLLGQNGHVRRVTSGAFNDAEYTTLKNEILDQMGNISIAKLTWRWGR